MAHADLHIHSIASDGEMTGEEIISVASEIGLKYISVTDHDGIGAYNKNGNKLFDTAKKAGLEILNGAEFDSEFQGVEIHILGYGMDLENDELMAYLKENHFRRKERMKEMISAFNGHFGEVILREDEIFIPGRETIMKPHIISILLEKGNFGNYMEAKKWIGTNIDFKTDIFKPDPEFIVKLIRRSGGEAVIAHPGYYIAPLGEDGFDGLLGDLVLSGLSGIEVFYDYASLTPDKFSLSYQKRLFEMLKDRSKKFGLVTTRGSDAHSEIEFRKRNRRLQI